MFKYSLEPDQRQIIMMPRGAQILSLGVQAGLPYLFALVDPAAPPEPRVFRNVTTGEEFNPEVLSYVGLVFLGGEDRKEREANQSTDETWYTLHCFEVETAFIPQSPDPVHPRFKEDVQNLKEEFAGHER